MNICHLSEALLLPDHVTSSGCASETFFLDCSSDAFELSDNSERGFLDPCCIIDHAAIATPSGFPTLESGMIDFLNCYPSMEGMLQVEPSEI